MIKKLLPVILFVIGTGAGVGAGIMLKKPSDAHASQEADSHGEDEAHADDGHGDDSHASDDHDTGHDDHGDSGGTEFVKLNNQFVVPVVRDEKIAALVVLSLNLEVQSGKTEFIYSREPKLRDTFLQVLFDHASIGGFEGDFTNSNRMKLLRQALREIAMRDYPDAVVNVLISDIIRQDVS